MLDQSLTSFYVPQLSQAPSPQTGAAFDLVALEICQENQDERKDQEAPLLSREQSIEMFLTMARNSNQPQIMENALGQALRLKRAAAAATLSSTMPTAHENQDMRNSCPQIDARVWADFAGLARCSHFDAQ